MEFIEPNVELWQQGDTIEDIWKHIARCVRVCYQSTPKDENENEEAFVKRVILRNEPMWSEANHLAMLEHGTIYLKQRADEEGPGLDKYDYNKYSKFRYIDFYSYVTTNLRVLVENNWLDDLQYICTPTAYHTRRYTFCFTTNIGVSREFNRHRVNSIAEESTRYCNYSKKNDGQIKIGLPAWLLQYNEYIDKHKSDLIDDYAKEIIDNTDSALLQYWCDIDFYLFALTACQLSYNMLIKKGWLPQQAREVLPLATKTQLVHTAFEDDWKHFIALRSDGISGKPHPNAKILADKVKEILEQ